MFLIIKLAVYVMILVWAVKIFIKKWKQASCEDKREEIQDKKTDLELQHELAEDTEDVNKKEVAEDKKKVEQFKSL